MNSRRMIILLVAIVAGAMASAAIYTYIGNVRTEATQGSEMVTVWRVAEPIPKGTPASQAIDGGFIVAEEVDISTRPATFVDDPATELEGLVAVIDLPANMTVVSGLFVSPGVVDTGITDRLEERGLVTVTVNFDQVSGAANFIEPGDRVNILAIRNRVGDTPGATTDSADESGAAIESGGDEEFVGTAPQNVGYVYQYVEVLAVGQNLTSDLGDVTEEGAIAPAASGLITFAVPPDAVQVILNADPGTLYLSLVPQSYVPEALLPLEEETLFPGETEGQLTPYWNVDAEEVDAETATDEENQ